MLYRETRLASKSGHPSWILHCVQDDCKSETRLAELPGHTSFSRNPAIPPALKKHATAGIRAGRATLPIFRGVSVARLPRHPPAGGLHVLQTCELAPSVPPFLAMTRLLRPGHHVEPARPHYRLTHRSFTTFRMTARAKPDPRPQRLGRKLACTKCMQRSGHAVVSPLSISPSAVVLMLHAIYLSSLSRVHMAGTVSCLEGEPP